MSWKDTLNLPVTAFPMKADLVRREPEIQARWDALGLYARLRRERAGRPKWVLHDGPPYANGIVHLGTARNKVLKDMAVRHRSMQGFDAPYVPGWDCHGMPIEHNVTKSLGPKARELPTPEFRRLCREYAEGFVASQMESFRRFAVLGDWEHPYLTMAPDYEAGVLDVFGEMLEKGYITRGLRSIHWCVTCATALAEAEIEYGPESSPSIHVAFALDADDLSRVGGSPTEAVIWTTTPWTLPANQAIAVHPELDYAVVEHDGPGGARRVLVALARVTAYLAAVQAAEHTVPLVVKGAGLVGAHARHPFLARGVPIVAADYVSADDGTGLVHTAPGHGADDFQTGVREGLEILCPVGPTGLYTPDVGVASLEGVHVFKANDPVLALLRESDALLALSSISHSYPHCWRCKQKLIFRATHQWFVSVDHENLRARALKACREDVRWFPQRSLSRITSMLEDRPDWCISRQRTWGVPIPALQCGRCGETHCTPEFVRSVRDVIAEHGADAWFERDAQAFTPAGLTCDKCGAAEWRQENDIFDVWFESGSSWRSVCTKEHDLQYPADCYLEGHDQHRGWFQLSLLPAMAVTGRPPFKDVVTHAFFINESGEKVSKSKGGMKDLGPDRVFGTIGVDICRLFFVTGDYFDEVPVSLGLVQPAGELYRKVRNTLRFLLGALDGYDPDGHAVAASDLCPIDAWALSVLAGCQERVNQACDAYEFQRAATLLREFMDRELSAFYLDLLKDRLYCAAPESIERRSAQTAIHALASALIRSWAPTLVHTAEEAWAALPGVPDDASVHLGDWPVPGTPEPALDAWIDALRAVRTEIEKKADPLRKQKLVGGGQDLAVAVHASGATHAALTSGAAERLGPDAVEGVLEILGVAELTLSDTALERTDVAGLSLTVSASELARCDRCRRRRADATTGDDGTLCTRCEPWRGRSGVAPA